MRSMRLGDYDAAKINARKRRRRRALSVAATIVVLLVVFGSAGFVYTWYIGQNTTVEEIKVPDTAVNRTLATPPTPTEESQVGVAVQALMSPVKVGENTSLSIRTLPQVACSIIFTYGETNKRSADTGLIPKIADEYGLVEWTWRVSEDVPAGTWPVEVTCANGSKSAYSRSDLVVTR